MMSIKKQGACITTLKSTGSPLNFIVATPIIRAILVMKKLAATHQKFGQKANFIKKQCCVDLAGMS